jgi:hypothetical protein
VALSLVIMTRLLQIQFLLLNKKIVVQNFYQWKIMDDKIDQVIPLLKDAKEKIALDTTTVWVSQINQFNREIWQQSK